MAKQLLKNLLEKQLIAISPDNSLLARVGGSQGRKLDFNSEDLAYSLYTYAKKYNKNTIIFEDNPESFDPRFLFVIQPVIKELLTVYKWKLSNLKYQCGAYSCQKNILLYDQHCTTNNLYRLPLTLTNFFESNMSLYIRKNINIFEGKTNNADKSKIFTCLNKVPRFQRIYLFLHFIKHGLLEKSYFSFLTKADIINNNIDDFLNEHLYQEKFESIFEELGELREPFLKSNIELPLLQTLSSDDFLGQHTISEKDMDMFNDSYFSVITETLFFNRINVIDSNRANIASHLDSIFFTEKTFRPIACKHPFIMVSRPGTLKALKESGYKTFSPWIDESYDEIEDDCERLKKIASIIINLAVCKPKSFWLNFFNETKDITEHNYQVLKNKFKD